MDKEEEIGREEIENEATFNKKVLLILKGILQDLKELNGKGVSN